MYIRQHKLPLFYRLLLKTVYTEDDVLICLRAHLQKGESIIEIGEYLPNISTTYLARICKRAKFITVLCEEGYNFNIWCKLFTPRIDFCTLSSQKITEQLQKLCDIYTIYEIAKILDCRWQTVLRQCQRHHISYIRRH